MKSIIELTERITKSHAIVVANADDEWVLKSLCQYKDSFSCKLILIGDKSAINIKCEALNIVPDDIISASGAENICQEAVNVAANIPNSILMKGMVPTAVIMRAILAHPVLAPENTFLSHFALMQIPSYHKLLALTDVAVNILPDAAKKIRILENAFAVMRLLCQAPIKTAVLAPTEILNPKIQSSVDAQFITDYYRKNPAMDVIVEGPFAFDIAVSYSAAQHKSMAGLVAGDADIILMPNLDTGNALYKSLVFLAGASAASIVIGAGRPLVLTSRSDSFQTKFDSLMLAAALASQRSAIIN